MTEVLRIFLTLLALYSLRAEGQKLMILGTAQDAGKPQIACNKSCCAPGTPQGKVTSLALLDPNSMRWSLIEASPDIAAQIAMIPPNYESLPTAIALSHAHIGHYTGLMYLGREALNAREMPIICGSRMAEFLSTNGPWSQLVDLKNIELLPIEASTSKPELSDQTEAGSFVVFTVPHRDEFSETLGMIIKGNRKSVLFIPDIDKWEKWDYSLAAVLKTVDYALVDGTFYDGTELPGRDMSEIPHPFVIETMQLLEDLAPSEKAKVYFIHLNHTNPLWDPQSKASNDVLKKGFNIAREGLILEL